MKFKAQTLPIIWAVALLAIAAAGWNRWPAIVQSPDERAASLQETYFAQQAAERSSPTAVNMLVAVTNSHIQAEKDVRYIRFVALFGIIGLAALGAWQVLLRRRSQSERQKGTAT